MRSTKAHETRTKLVRDISLPLVFIRGSSFFIVVLKLSFANRDPANNIPTRDVIHNFHPGNHVAKDRVAAIEMGLRGMGHEPLRTSSVFPRQSHADRAAFVKNFVDLTTNLITRSAVRIATRIARLNHKVRHHARNRLPIEVTFARKLNEIINRQRCVLGKKLDSEAAFAGDDGRSYFPADARYRAMIISIRVARLDRTDAIRKIA